MTNRRFVLGSGATLIASLMLARRAHAAATVMVPSPASPLSAQERALHALNRLGYGPRPADSAAIAEQGAQAWLERYLGEQLQPERLSMPADMVEHLARLEVLQLTPNELLRRYRDERRLARQLREAQGGARQRAASGVPSGLPGQREYLRALQQQASAARLLRAQRSPAQLNEVLTDFWFNHFNVFAGKAPVGLLIADYEQRAIRPYVLGRFRDMLGATARHPAMLIYLDNARSSRDSQAAASVRRGLSGKSTASGGAARRGLNENFARELMELHTLGVDGGYTQQDVTELARMLTGWGLDAAAIESGTPGDGFRFEPRRHDEGGKTWLGRNIRATGQREGEFALDVLASHPATARHLGYKFAQAFVADEPPPALVQRLADSFLASGGDLHAFTRTLLRSDEFWSREAYRAKFKTPYQYLISSLRALELLPGDPQPLLAALSQAGQPLYGATTPDGYKNTAAAWRSPEALTQRVQLAATLGARSGISAARLGETLGGLLTDATHRALASEPPAQQLALLLASPDFMRH